MEFPYLNVKQAAESLGIQPGAIRDAVARGRITAIRVGGGEKRAGSLLFTPAEIERYREEVLGKRGYASPLHKGKRGRPPKERPDVP